MYGQAAVSYTHLDVDKRQKLGYTGIEGYIPLTTYTVNLIAQAPLKIGTVASPIEYELYNGQNDEIHIPFSNLYGCLLYTSRCV